MALVVCTSKTKMLIFLSALCWLVHNTVYMYFQICKDFKVIFFKVYVNYDNGIKILRHPIWNCLLLCTHNNWWHSLRSDKKKILRNIALRSFGSKHPPKCSIIYHTKKTCFTSFLSTVSFFSPISFNFSSQNYIYGRHGQK